MTTPGIVLEVLGLSGSRGDHEDELHSGRGDLGLRTPQHRQEVGIAEEPILALGDQESDGIAAPGHQGARGQIGPVRELGRDPEHRVAGLVADVARAPQDPTRGRARHPSRRGDHLEGGRHRASSAHSERSLMRRFPKSGANDD